VSLDRWIDHPSTDHACHARSIPPPHPSPITPITLLAVDGPSSSSGSSSSSSSRQEAHRVSQLFDEIALEEFAKEEEGGRLNRA